MLFGYWVLRSANRLSKRYPVAVLLAENGIEATGDLTSFPALGDAKTIANLLVLRREKETQNQGLRKLEDVAVSPDGKTLTFRLRTEIEVQKPELLMEQFGVSQLFRITVAKASLSSGDGNLMGKTHGCDFISQLLDNFA